MFGYDLGPALFSLFIFVIVLPAGVGFVFGSWIGKRLEKNRKSINLRIKSALICALIFPLIWIGFNYQQTTYYKYLNRSRLEEYQKKIVDTYAVTAFVVDKTVVQVGITVPRDGSYDIYIYELTDGEVLLNRNLSQEYMLMKGDNTITIPLSVDSDGNEYGIKILNNDRTLQFVEKKSLYRSNSTSRSYYEGIIYHSSGLSGCPLYNYDNLPCISSSLLRGH